MPTEELGMAALDIAIVNAQIHTLNRRNSIVEALGVKANKITLLGSNREIEAFTDGKTRVMDARGRLVLPGFIRSTGPVRHVLKA